MNIGYYHVRSRRGVSDQPHHRNRGEIVRPSRPFVSLVRVENLAWLWMMLNEDPMVPSKESLLISSMYDVFSFW